MKDERPSPAAEMAAFDALPPAVRQTLAFAPFAMRATDVLGALGCMFEREVMRMIRNTAAKFVEFENKRWLRKCGQPSPHVAAGATVLLTEPLTGTEGGARRRFLRRMRDPAAAAIEDAALVPKPPEPPVKPPKSRPPDVIQL